MEKQISYFFLLSIILTDIRGTWKVQRGFSMFCGVIFQQVENFTSYIGGMWKFFHILTLLCRSEYLSRLKAAHKIKSSGMSAVAAA